MTKPKRSISDRQIDAVITEAYRYAPDVKVALELRKMTVSQADFRDYLKRTILRSDISCNVEGNLRTMDHGIELKEHKDLITPITKEEKC